MGHEDLSAITARAQQRVGKVVREKWQIDALLGVGGMATVYGATHRNGKRAALKFLHAELLVSDTLRTRFLREGHVANRVGHPGAVSVIDDDVAEDGAAYLVMELLEGENLEQRLKNGGTLSCDDVLLIAEQVLDVLVSAHAKNIIHRDLKPANIFVCTDGRVKILDFGIARLREMPGTDPSGGGAGLVTTISSMGTPSFMPPEQARGRWELVDARSDLWAVGATMFTLLTGRFVHVEQTTNEQLLANMTKPAPPLHEIAPDLPADIAAVIDRALAFSSSDRWPDADAMQKAVRAAYTAMSGKDMTQRRRVLLSTHDANTSGEAATLLAQSAPTLVASSVSSPGPPLRVETADAPTARTSTMRRTLAIVGGAAILVGAIALVTFGGSTKTSTPSTTATTPRATSTPVPTPVPTPTSNPTEEATATSQPAMPSASTSAEKAKTPAKPPSKAKPSPVPSPSGVSVGPAPSASTTVDIFGRRR